MDMRIDDFQDVSSSLLSRFVGVAVGRRVSGQLTMAPLLSRKFESGRFLKLLPRLLYEDKKVSLMFQMPGSQLGVVITSPKYVSPSRTPDGPPGILIQCETRKIDPCCDVAIVGNNGFLTCDKTECPFGK
jgi:hypothetical protein